MLGIESTAHGARDDHGRSGYLRAAWHRKKAGVLQRCRSMQIRRATPSDRATIAELIGELIPGADPQRRMAWLYDGNPQGTAATWLAIDDDRVAGLTSYFPFDVWHHDRVVHGAVGGDGYVRPAFRRRGIASALHAAARADMRRLGIELMYGAPTAANIRPLQQGGSHVVSDVVRYVCALRGRAIGLHGWASRLVSGVLAPRRGRERLVPAYADDERIDDVWRRTRDELAIATVRDARFYTWRFHDSPSQRQLPYVVVDADARPFACCAIEHVGDRVLIVDVVSPAATWRRAIDAIARHAYDRDRSAIEIKLLRDDASRRSPWRNGFVRREGKPFLVVLPDDAAGSDLGDRASWYYTGADADIDTLTA
jgi:GNAT superfamily N-acetyltransferase